MSDKNVISDERMTTILNDIDNFFLDISKKNSDLSFTEMTALILSRLTLANHIIECDEEFKALLIYILERNDKEAIEIPILH